MCLYANTKLGGQASAAAVGFNLFLLSFELIFFPCVQLKSWDPTSDTSLTWTVDISAGTSM